MTELITVVVALTVSIAVIPVMMRLAPRLGMIDLPDPRKVHVRPVPRVGGIGIALGALVATGLAWPSLPWLPWYLAGAAILLVFGALDDAREMGHYLKFAGQFLAVVPVVWFGDLWVSALPFLSEPLPPAVGKPFTVVAIVGVVNAVNHSDGLDGLAGGEAVLSLGCIALLAHLAADVALMLLCFAVLGGLLGFLRFNTHPARVFMGDAGSQFVGLSLGVFVVALTQRSDTSLSMALPGLILGLPLADILAVLWLRVTGGMHWFRATRNHVHHRMLGLGLDHHEAVVVIYALQAGFVMAALNLRHESDVLVGAMYAGPCALLFAGLTFAERCGWRVQQPGRRSGLSRLLHVSRAAAMGRMLVGFVAFVLPLFYVAGAFAVRTLPEGAAPALGVIALLLALRLALPDRAWLQVAERVSAYSLAPLWVFGVERQLQALAPTLLASTIPFYGGLAIAIALVWRLAPDREFAPTPMDFLVAVAAIATTFLAPGAQATALLIKVVVLLYACELVFVRASASARTLFTLAALASALVALLGGIR